VIDMGWKGWKEKSPYIVSDATCKGCCYYGHLINGWSVKCCTYTLETGRARPLVPCAECTVKSSKKEAIPKFKVVSSKNGKKAKK